MSDVLGYVVVERIQPSGQPNPDHAMALTSDLGWALKLAGMQQGAARRGQRYTVHAVMAEEIEETSRG